MKVLITGASGLVGKRLSERLLEKGYEVSVLSRSGGINGGSNRGSNRGSRGEIKTYMWDPDKHSIDPESVNSCDYIVHLAGLNIGAGKWTSDRKRKIVDSRINSTQLILDSLDQGKVQLKAFISASAIGYYGAFTADKILIESDPPGNDFLGQTCLKWETAGDGFSEMGIRKVNVRTGIVLSGTGGALPRIAFPVKWGFGAAIGTGRQYMPWIHLDDLCDIYIQALENSQMEGAYNAVAPQYVTNKEFTREVALSLKKPLWLPNIPSWFMKILFGEMSDMLLYGSRVSSAKIEQAEYIFRYPELKESLKQIYG